MIPRARETAELRRLISRNPVVCIVGARQVGKTTIARQIAAASGGASTYFDLENPGDLALFADPMLTLSGLRGLVIIDEVQRRPDLFPVLRVLCDRPRAPARFLVLGSASPDLLHQTSESLAGRIAYHDLGGLAMHEVGTANLDRLWLRGGFPRSYAARSLRESEDWRRSFIRTLLERDLRGLGFEAPAPTLSRFWHMLAHYHGQRWASAEFARSFGVADTTVRRYLDGLAGALVVHLLQPWFENLAKRQVKAPKVYIADSGVTHTLLGITSKAELLRHPKCGASWEGFVIGELIRHVGARFDERWYWGTHNGAELDLLVVRGGRRLGFEIKHTTTPAVTPSMRVAMTDLRLSSLDVIYAGDRTFTMADGIRAVPVVRLLDDITPLRM